MEYSLALGPIPLDELEGTCECSACGEPLTDDPYIDEDGDLYCEPCAEHRNASAEAEADDCERDARLFAAERCEILDPLPPIGADEPWPVYAARCRHEHTNYDDLCAEVGRHSREGRIYYQVIRERINLLIDREADRLGTGREEGGPDYPPSLPTASRT